SCFQYLLGGLAESANVLTVAAKALQQGVIVSLVDEFRCTEPGIAEPQVLLPHQTRVSRRQRGELGLNPQLKLYWEQGCETREVRSGMDHAGNVEYHANDILHPRRDRTNRADRA